MYCAAQDFAKHTPRPRSVSFEVPFFNKRVRQTREEEIALTQARRHVQQHQVCEYARLPNRTRGLIRGAARVRELGTKQPEHKGSDAFSTERRYLIPCASFVAALFHQIDDAQQHPQTFRLRRPAHLQLSCRPRGRPLQQSSMDANHGRHADADASRDRGFGTPSARRGALPRTGTRAASCGAATVPACSVRRCCEQ